MGRARFAYFNAPAGRCCVPTVGLDPINEMELLDTMLTATEGKTVLWITHHLAGVEAMDQIIFLENGRIKMQGSHDELMATEPHYRRLYEMDQA